MEVVTLKVYAPHKLSLTHPLARRRQTFREAEVDFVLVGGRPRRLSEAEKDQEFIEVNIVADTVTYTGDEVEPEEHVC